MVPINNIIHIPSENLRVLAIAPPDHLAGTAGEGVLMGADPASLYNACRYAAFKADHNMGAWGEK